MDWRRYLLWDLLCVSVLFCSHVGVQGSAEEFDILMDFMKAVDPDGGLNNTWDKAQDHCLWKGITCSPSVPNMVTKIRLENMELNGTVDAISLCSLPSLRVVGLEENNLRGSIPEEISGCKNITHIYLSYNQLSGSIPDSLASLSSLHRLNLSHNKLTGPIPAGFSRLSGLMTLLVDINELSGEIPALNLTMFQDFNVSYNNLSGRLPEGSEHFPNSAYFGNEYLCGTQASGACNMNNTDNHGKKEKGLKWGIYIVLLAVIILCFIFIHIYKKKHSSLLDPKKTGNGTKSGEFKSIDDGSKVSQKGIEADSSSYYSNTSDKASTPSDRPGVLTSFDKDQKLFALDDLLRASAEPLGQGSFGNLYRVIMADGTTLAVKRLKDLTISGQEFEQRMEKIGRLKHPNVLPLLAYYSSKDEKLFIYEYQRNGSLSSLLQMYFREHKPLSWTTRLAIASGVARGLAYMHHEFESDIIPHGNLKPSNILLNQKLEPCISEYGFVSVVDTTRTHHLNANAPQFSSASRWNGYRAPDKRITQKADVYSFGMILLELLTGKMVENSGIDLPRWVQSIVREEWTVEVFDREIVASAGENRVVSLLQIALNCVSYTPENRPEMSYVSGMIDKLWEFTDDCSFTSQSSVGLSEAGLALTPPQGS